MGCMNQFNFIRENIHLIKGPILEVGSKDYGSTPNLRPLLPDCRYVGVDQEAGKGVDVVLNLTGDLHTITSRLPVAKFNTVICLSVLEHCRNPFTMCDNLSQLLNSGGLVFISVPFSWKIHAYPSDYWRFTPEGVKTLFPGFDFDVHPGHLSTVIEGERDSINDSMMCVEMSVKKALEHRRCGVLSAVSVHVIKKLGILSHVFRYRHLFPPVMLNMIGVKR